jgi:alpha-mannosidase
VYRLVGGPADSGLPWSDGIAPSSVTATQTSLENAFLRVEFDPQTGWISSLLDKRTGVDTVAGAVGEHTQISEDPTDTWGHRVVSYAGAGAAMKLDRILVRESGELRAVLRIERSWGSSSLVEEFVLAADSPALKVNVTLDWREKAHLLKLRFPTAIENPTGTFEIPYGFMKRDVDGAEQPGQSWIDLTGTVGNIDAGLAVINDAKHGYDLSPANCPSEGLTASLGITAVRSAVYSWHDPQTLDPEGLYSYQDQGIQRFSYELVPHGVDWRDADLMRRAQQLGTHMRAQLETFHDGTLPSQDSFIQVEQLEGEGQVNITALKGAEDASDSSSKADIIVRLVEQAGAAASVRCHMKFMGNRSFTAQLEPCTIHSYLVPSDPTAPVQEVDLVERTLTKPGESADAATSEDDAADLAALVADTPEDPSNNSFEEPKE